MNTIQDQPTGFHKKKRTFTSCRRRSSSCVRLLMELFFSSDWCSRSWRRVFVALNCSDRLSDLSVCCLSCTCRLVTWRDAKTVSRRRISRKRRRRKRRSRRPPSAAGRSRSPELCSPSAVWTPPSAPPPETPTQCHSLDTRPGLQQDRKGRSQERRQSEKVQCFSVMNKSTWTCVLHILMFPSTYF